MTGFRLHFDLDDAAPRAALDRLADPDLTPLMAQIGLALETAARRRIEQTNIGPDGAPWPQSKAAQKRGTPTLFEKRRLAASLTHQAAAARAEVGTNLAYAAIHQFGGVIQRWARSQPLYFKYDRREGAFRGFAKKSKANFMKYAEIGEGKTVMPARPYLGVSAEDEKAIQGLARAFFHGRIAP